MFIFLHSWMQHYCSPQVDYCWETEANLKTQLNLQCLLINKFNLSNHIIKIAFFSGQRICFHIFSLNFTKFKKWLIKNYIKKQPSNMRIENTFCSKYKWSNQQGVVTKVRESQRHNRLKYFLTWCEKIVGFYAK